MNKLFYLFIFLRVVIFGFISAGAAIFSYIMKAQRIQLKPKKNQIRLVKKLKNPCKANAVNQCFALPQPIMKYLTQQPSSARAWIKLIQTCKYFFGSNPILVVSEFKRTLNKSWLISNLNNKKLKLKPVNFKSYKLWLMGSLLNFDPKKSIISDFPEKKIVTKLVPHVYQCGLRRLCLDGQKLSYKEFQFLTKEKTIWGFHLSDTVITYADGTRVPLEVILEALPVVEVFNLDDSHNYITPETSENLLMLPKFKNFEVIQLSELRNNLDPESIVQFLKKQKIHRANLDLMGPIPLNYVKTFVAAMKEFTEDEENQQFINCIEVYHEDDLIFKYCMDVMF